MRALAVKLSQFLQQTKDKLFYTVEKRSICRIRAGSAWMLEVALNLDIRCDKTSSVVSEVTNPGWSRCEQICQNSRFVNECCVSVVQSSAVDMLEGWIYCSQGCLAYFLTFSDTPGRSLYDSDIIKRLEMYLNFPFCFFFRMTIIWLSYCSNSSFMS